MQSAPRLKNGVTIPSTAIRCANRFAPPSEQRWVVQSPWLPAAMTTFASREDALDGFLGAAYALHLVAMVSVMAEGRDLQKAVGSGDGAWFVSADLGGRGQLRSAETGDEADGDVRGFTPTIFIYDNYPGGVGLSLPLFERRGELRRHALGLVRDCMCKAGCPACVGPVLAADEDAGDMAPKAAALAVLELLGEPA